MATSLYIHRNQSKKRRKRMVFLLKMLFVFFVFWLIGLIWFIGFKPSENTIPPALKVDGIIVLTGGGGRIEAGLEAMDKNVSKAMLISGVNANIDATTIFNVYNVSVDNCDDVEEKANIKGCITLGRKALDTRGNAHETKEWAAEHGFRSILVITSDYHMRRALTEINNIAPELLTHSLVVTTSLKWSSIALEYTKYLYSLGHAFIF